MKKKFQMTRDDMTNRKEMIAETVRMGLAVLFVLCAFPGTELAFATDTAATGSASATGMAEVISDFMANQLTYMPNLIVAITFIGGILAMVGGVLKLKDHAESPAQHRIGPGLARLCAGSALVSLPLFAKWVLTTSSLPSSGSLAFMKFNSGMGSY